MVGKSKIKIKKIKFDRFFFNIMNLKERIYSEILSLNSISIDANKLTDIVYKFIITNIKYI